MNKLRIAVGILFVTFFSCSPEEDFEITTIEGIPSAIKGCSCIFSRTQEDFENNKYIFFNTGKISILSVNGELLTWSPFSEEESPYTIITTYSSEERMGSERKAFEGEIIITSKNGESTKFPIYGQCGC